MSKLLWILGFRYFIRSKLYVGINILGLTLGLLSFGFIMLFVTHEQSFDSFHHRGKHIYRLISHSKARSAAITPYVWGRFLKNDLAQVENYVAVQTLALTVRKGDEVFTDPLVLAADSTFFEIFSFPVRKGPVDEFLRHPDRIILTPQMAVKYFGDQDPIGRLIELKHGNDFVPYEVQGVVECPDNSHLRFNFIIPFAQVKRSAVDPGAYEHWRIHFVNTYLLMSDFDLEELRQQFQDFLLRHAGEEVMEAYRPDVEPLSDIYLKSDLHFDQPPRGSAENNRILSLVAFGILAIAIINFINLTTAQSLRRAREVSVRKVFGSSRRSLMIQFIGESTITACIAMVLAVALASAILPEFNHYTNKHIALAEILSTDNGIILLLFTLAVGFVSGLYPALILSSFRPVTMLRTRSSTSTSSGLARKILVTVQFGLAVVLLVSTGVIYLQVRYMQNRDLGFNKDQSIAISDGGQVSSSPVQTELLRRELLKTGRVLTVSASSTYAGQQTWAMRFQPEGHPEGEENPSISTVFADHDYLKTYDVEIRLGRDFDRQYRTDSSAVLINEAAVRLFSNTDPSWSDTPLGKKLAWNGFTGSSGNSEVIGVFRDFNFETLRREISPLIIMIEPKLFFTIQMKLRAENLSETLATVEATWKKLFPEVPFSYLFVDEEFARHYQSDQKLVALLQVFAVLSVVVAVSGLFGLATFLAAEKSKEMSIRKVVGASQGQILLLLSWLFLKLIVIANFIAIPLSYYYMHRWLNEFAYRIEMPVSIPVFTLAVTLLVSAATVSYHAYRTASINPADILARE